MKLELEIISATVLITSSTDLLVLKYKGRSTYPNWLPDELPSIKIELQKGYGVEYCQKEFGITPNVLNTNQSIGTPKNFS